MVLYCSGARPCLAVRYKIKRTPYVETRDCAVCRTVADDFDKKLPGER